MYRHIRGRIGEVPLYTSSTVGSESVYNIIIVLAAQCMAWRKSFG